MGFDASSFIDIGVMYGLLLLILSGKEDAILVIL